MKVLSLKTDSAGCARSKLTSTAKSATIASSASSAKKAILALIVSASAANLVSESSARPVQQVAAVYVLENIL